MIEMLKEVVNNEMNKEISCVFSCMEIAEKIIKEQKKKHPHHTHKIFDAFKFMVPSPILHDCPERAYRAHCEEIIERLLAGAPVDSATDAEMCVALSQTSLKAPLRHDYVVLYERLMSRRLGYVSEGSRFREDYPGSINEIEAGLREELTVKKRGE